MDPPTRDPHRLSVSNGIAIVGERPERRGVLPLEVLLTRPLHRTDDVDQRGLVGLKNQDVALCRQADGLHARMMPQVRSV